jgi:hypothetical protein
MMGPILGFVVEVATYLAGNEIFMTLANSAPGV